MHNSYHKINDFDRAKGGCIMVLVCIIGIPLIMVYELFKDEILATV